MASTLEMNKIVGAVLVGGLVSMLAGAIAHILVNPGHHGGGGEVAGAMAPATAPSAPVIEPVSPLLAKADPQKGQQITKVCQSCHDFTKGGPNKIGPNLWGIVGSKPAEVPGYSFSDAMKARADKPWTYEALNDFLASPKTLVPGTKMTFPGLPKVAERADVIAYLRTLADQPLPLPSDADIAAAEKAYDEAKKAAAQPAAAQAQPAAAAQPAQAQETQTQAAAAQPAAAPIAERLKTADPAKGEAIAQKCKACHDFNKGGPNKVGPNLWNIVGSKPGEVPNYSFSDAMKARADKPWTYEALDAFLTSPRTDVPGTKMTFVGLPKAQERADLIAWLRLQSDSPVPLP
jgi:cytochrome c